MKTKPLYSLSHLTGFFLEWEMFQTQVVEKIKTHALRSILFVLNRAGYEIMWKYILQPDNPQMILWRISCADGYLRLQNTHSEYVLHIAFPLQQWFQKRVSVLRYTYIAGPVTFSRRCELHSSGMTPSHWVVGSRCFETMYWSIFNYRNVRNGHYIYEIGSLHFPETSGTNYPVMGRHPSRM
jgi:hypothetical protein